ncbi:MAG: hydroxymethylpyrimidine/phosphomethylpyrimidine kinase [Desulfurobacteriaceae bacterium]
MKEFLLSIAGFDPTGGAGILRDIRTFNYFGFLGASVITVNTAQNTKGVKLFEFMDEKLILNQLNLVLEELDIKGVKIGIPHKEERVNKEIAKVVGSLKVPVVFDPVLSPTFGKDFVENVSVLEPILEVSSVITPNEREYRILKESLRNFDGYVILKGKKLNENLVEDVLMRRGNVLRKIKHEKDSLVIRGTGCAFSSAVLSFLAKGHDIGTAFEKASLFLEEYRRRHFWKSNMRQGYSLL